MTQQHPITPPDELVQQWRKSGPVDAAVNNAYERHIATCAAQWGADQELEACCEWLRSKDILEPAIDALRADRRPKRPSLKEQALMGLSRIESTGEFFSDGMKDLDIIRRALEQLPDCE